MKSKMKKLVSLVLAMAMVLTMGIGMSAAKVEAADTTTYTITINNDTDGYKYTAYQIFAGELSGSSLSNVVFGAALTETDQESLLSDYSSILDGATYESSAAGLAAALGDSKITADDFAEKLATYSMTSAGTSNYDSTNANYTISVTGAGYYLVVNNTVPSGNYAYSDYILEVVKDTSVDPKSSVPSVEKKVEEKNDSTSDAAVWQDAADYDIGDVINYKLTGTMPSTLDDYSTYYYVFTDTLSAGLTVMKADGTTEATVDGTGSNDLTVDDVTVTVYANAANAAAGTSGTVVKSGYTVSLADVTGLTSEDTYYGGTILTVTIADVLSMSDGTDTIAVDSNSVIVVTYSAKLNDDANIGSTGNPNEVVLTFSNNPNNAGSSETGKTPEDKVTVFTFNLEINKVNEESVALAGAAFTLYKYVYSYDADADKETSDYVAVKTISTGSTFTFEGLDSGKYKIEETVTPAGYNSISAIEFEIAATYDTSSDDPQLKGLEVKNATSGTTFTVEETNYTKVSTTITNKSGSTLPSTGGIGTTIFYIVGAILVLGAGVVLVTRRRTAR